MKDIGSQQIFVEVEFWSLFPFLCPWKANRKVMLVLLNDTGLCLLSGKLLGSKNISTSQNMKRQAVMVHCYCNCMVSCNVNVMGCLLLQWLRSNLISANWATQTWRQLKHEDNITTDNFWALVQLSKETTVSGPLETFIWKVGNQWWEKIHFASGSSMGNRYDSANLSRASDYVHCSSKG